MKRSQVKTNRRGEGGERLRFLFMFSSPFDLLFLACDLTLSEKMGADVHDGESNRITTRKWAIDLQRFGF